MLKVVKILQMMWLIIAIVAFIMATYNLIFSEMRDALFFYFFAGFALLLFYIRKRQLKRLKNMSK